MTTIKEFDEIAHHIVKNIYVMYEDPNGDIVCDSDNIPKKLEGIQVLGIISSGYSAINRDTMEILVSI